MNPPTLAEALANDRNLKDLQRMLARLVDKQNTALGPRQQERLAIGRKRSKATQRMIEKRYGMLGLVKGWVRVIEGREAAIRRNHADMAKLMVKFNALTNSIIYGIIRRQGKMQKLYFRMGARTELIKQRVRESILAQQRKELRQRELARKQGLPI